MLTHKTSKLVVAAATSTLVMLLAAAVIGQQSSAPGLPPGPAAADPGVASPAERSALIEAVVAKWGPYVQSEFGADVNVWQERMLSRYLAADATNLREAASRDTYEGAMAALNGRGDRLSDADITRLTAAAAADSLGTRSIGPLTLGALSNDLVYTPIQPCRIIDTRNTGAGAIATNSTRSFVAVNASNFAGQGGSATNCGTLGLAATAVAINLTAVTPVSAGYATVFPFGTAQPLSSSVNYAGGDVVNNAIIAKIPNPLSSFDFTVYTFAQSHYVADIVGYFAPNVATGLQCTDTANTSVTGIVAGGTANAVAPACPTGYTQTATNCEASSWLVPFVFFHAGTCSARNNDTTPQDIRASRTCCRVPGR